MSRIKRPIRGDQLDLLGEAPSDEGSSGEAKPQKQSRSPKFRGQKAAQTGKTRTLNLEDLIRAADALSDAELRQLQAGIDALLEVRNLGDKEEAETPKNRTLNLDNPKLRGSIEEKMINGCGPYRYLRWWSGGKHRSTYLGKVKVMD